MRDEKLHSTHTPAASSETSTAPGRGDSSHFLSQQAEHLHQSTSAGWNDLQLSHGLEQRAEERQPPSLSAVTICRKCAYGVCLSGLWQERGKGDTTPTVNNAQSPKLRYEILLNILWSTCL